RGIITDYNYTGLLAGVWEDPMRGIFRANQVISRLPEMDIDQALKDRLTAEVKFLRGLYFFESALLFGNVPRLLEPADVTTQPAFTPVNGVYAQVVTDDLAAANVLPWRWTGDDVGRATKGAALAL